MSVLLGGLRCISRSFYESNKVGVKIDGGDTLPRLKIHMSFFGVHCRIVLFGRWSEYSLHGLIDHMDSVALFIRTYIENPQIEVKLYGGTL